MHLYARPELLMALFNNIRQRRGKKKGPLRYEELLPFDHCHYGGTQVLDQCIPL
jgi:hypothetical protein